MTHPDSHTNAFKLSLFTGNWVGHGQVFANAWSPAATCEGQWKFAFDRSGHNLIHDYHEARNDGVIFDGHGVFNLDAATKEVIWFWFDSYGFPPVNPARGQWDDEKLILIKHTERGTGKSTFRFSHNLFTYLTEVQQNGEAAFAPVMQGEFKKIRNEF